MTQFWPRFKWRIIAGSLGALFHLCTVVLVLVLSGGKGEGQAGLVFILDLPLALFVLGVPTAENILYSYPYGYIIFFSFFGTLLYAGLGWIVGCFLDSRAKYIKND